MKKGQNIHYIDRPNEKDFPDRDVAKLVNILNEVPTTCSGVRHQIASALLNNQRLSHFPGVARLAYTIDPKNFPVTQMREFRDEGNTIIAKDGEKTVGMIGFQEHIPTSDGRRLFEIRRTTVLKDYRGHGIGRVLRESIIKRLRDIDSDALLVSRIHKDNAPNQNLAKSTHFTLMSDDKLQALGITEKWILRNKEPGYEYYIFDPRKEDTEK